jgi:hypothetical protein
MTHIVLFLLITTEDTNLSDIRLQKPVQHSIAERASTSGNQ